MPCQLYHPLNSMSVGFHLVVGYVAILEPEEGDTGRYSVTFPDLPGCITQGETKGEALKAAHEALLCHLQGMFEDGDEIPQPSNPNQFYDKDYAVIQIQLYPLKDLVRTHDRDKSARVYLG